MFKKIVWIISLAVIIAVGMKGYITFSAYSMVEQIKKEFADQASISYGWISADYDGNVVIDDISLTFFRLKRSMSVAELSLAFGSASNVINHSKNILAENFKQNISLKAKGVSVPLKGKTLKTWIKENYEAQWLVVSDVHACPASSNESQDLLKQMGMNEIDFDLTLAFSEEQGNDTVELLWDIDQTGRFSTTVSWAQPNRINLKNIISGILELDKANIIELEYSDEGFIRRLRNVCEKSESDIFPEMSSLSWQAAVTSLGWQVNTGIQTLYRDYLSQGGVINVKVAKPNNLLVDKVESIFGLNMVDHVGFEASVNRKVAEGLVLMADEPYFREKMRKETPETEEKVAKVEYQSMYRETDPGDLKNWLDRKVRIKLKDGKVYEGVLQSVAEHKIDMLVNVAGGTVVYSLKPFGIEKAEVWR